MKCVDLLQKKEALVVTNTLSPNSRGKRYVFREGSSVFAEKAIASKKKGAPCERRGGGTRMGRAKGGMNLGRSASRLKGGVS